MGRITILPADLVNRIAAGECVERPASVVKELIENALDAGARRINVTVLDGGRELIQVGDDGCGMDADDLARCVLPHATSKIRSDDDLFNIRTMGFRGEALPSIGSVARLEIVSRPPEHDVAHRITVEAGRVSSPVPCAAPVGTTVSVRDLFYCVPARRKFLKTPQTEMGHITEQFARIALGNPQVALSLRHGKRLVHRLPATDDPRRRIADFYGPELAEVLLEVERSDDDLAVRGWAAPPAESRGSTKWEYVFVNGRYVRDRFVSHAIREAYRGLIDANRFPVVFLFITVEPALVDVNVHPTKIELRWRDSNRVHSLVLAALRERFLATNLDHGLDTSRAADDHQQRVRQALVDFFRKAPAAPPDPGRWPGRPADTGPQTPPARPAPTSGQAPAGGPVSPGDAAAAGGAAAPGDLSAAGPSSGDHEGSAGSAAQHQPPPPAGQRRPRALQIHNAYIVVETADGLMIIDQHALHERVLYEQFRRRLAERPLQSQRLLIPETVRVPPDRLEVLETHAELLGRLGIELTPSGPQTVTLHAFPTLLSRTDAQRFVRDLLDTLSEAGSRPGTETLIHELLDMMACKAAVKAGDPLSDEEIAALLRCRELAERSSHCPHGRPTTLQLTLRDLERQFKRR